MPDALFENTFRGADRTTLEQIITEYPYFSLAHYYLLKQSHPGDLNYPRQLAKTALHFNNPFLLLQSLEGNQQQAEERLYNGSILEENNTGETELTVPDHGTNYNNDFNNNPGIIPEDHTVAGLEANDPVNNYNSGFNEDPANIDNQNMVDEVEEGSEYRNEVNNDIHEPTINRFDTVEEVTDLTGQENDFRSDDNIPDIIPDENRIEAVAAPSAADEDQNELSSANFSEEKNVEEKTDTGISNISSNDSQNSTAAIQEEKEMIFEPLYATDYFASQGIKINQDAPATDKLGKQLKSFTEWLKTMKRVHEISPSEKELDPVVQHMAEKSNIEEDIVTESMAEVFQQQGKVDKARDIYVKLSLLNPTKSAYFAAKIENLNTT